MSATKAPGKNWLTIGTLALSGLGIAYFLFQAMVLSAAWLISFFDTQNNLVQSISINLILWSSLLSGVLLVPLFLLSLARLRNRTAPLWLDAGRPINKRIITGLVIAWPLLILLGWWIAGQPMAAAFLLGPLNVLVAGVPVMWVFTAAQKELDGGSKLRKWRLFGFSLIIMPLLVIFFEVIAVVVLGGAGLGWFAFQVSRDPSLERELTVLGNQLMNLGDDVDLILTNLLPLIQQPGVLVWLLSVIAGIMPLIEEVIKPAALWSLAGRKISDQEGFVGGLICGAGFALMENVLFFTTVLTAEDWLFLAVGRAGTGVLHMLASGLAGWGLAKAWRDGKFLFLGLMTFGAFLLHAVWNALAVISGFAPILVYGTEQIPWQGGLFYLPVIILLLFSVLALCLINRHFRRRTGQGRHERQAGEDGSSENDSNWVLS